MPKVNLSQAHRGLYIVSSLGPPTCFEPAGQVSNPAVLINYLLHMTPTPIPEDHEHDPFMRQALEQAAFCEPVQTAFCVGCVLVARFPDSEPIVLSKGFSRELPGNTHAEANALTKFESLTSPQLQSLVSPWPLEAVPVVEDILPLVDVYTTLEPCSVRTSGLSACADALIRARIRRCIIGVQEPDDFVKCEGAQKMKDAGVEVIWYGGLEQECLDAARRGHHT